MVKDAITKTITSIFMVPILKIPRETLKENKFLNGYIKDKVRGIEYDDAIFLLFRPEQLDRFRVFLDSEYERTKNIIDDYDHPGGFVVVVYKLNPDYAEDYALIRKGKYSKTSPEFQAEFPKKVTIKTGFRPKQELSLHYRIFNRTEELLRFWEEKLDVTFGDNQEVWEGFLEERETLTEEKLKEYEQ